MNYLIVEIGFKDESKVINISNKVIDLLNAEDTNYAEKILSMLIVVRQVIKNMYNVCIENGNQTNTCLKVVANTSEEAISVLSAILYDMMVGLGDEQRR